MIRIMSNSIYSHLSPIFSPSAIIHNLKPGAKNVGILESNSGHKNLVVVMLPIFWVSFWAGRKIFRGGRKIFRWVKNFEEVKKCLRRGGKCLGKGGAKKFVRGVKNF